jgi:VWFA-related protein
MRNNRGRAGVLPIAIGIAGAVIAGGFAMAQQGPPSQPSGNSLTVPVAPHQKPMPSAGASPMQPPHPQPDDALELPSLRLRRQLGYQQVTITVTDKSGKYITNLNEDDFRIFEDGEQRSILFFRTDRNAPVSVGIVVDCSSSMATKFPQARAAIRKFVDDLDLNDDIFLESFSVEAELMQPFTLDHSKIIKQMDFLHPMTQTSLYDAILMGLVEVERGRRDKKALLVVTDGMDNRSTFSLTQVIGLARRLKVLIYSIGIGDEQAQEPGMMGGMLSPDSEQVDAKTLKTLSEETGAKTYLLRRVGDGAELVKDCEAISNELRQQYTIGYVSVDPGRPGYRSLRVDTPTHPDLSVRVRKGVAVRPP